HWCDSSAYHRCSKAGCDVEESSYADLLQHWRDAQCYTVCEGCSSGIDGDLATHLQGNNGCMICHQHFKTLLSGDGMHQIPHYAADYKCWGCNCTFRCFSTMILHLEAGYCESGCTISDLNEVIADLSGGRYVMKDLISIHPDPHLPFECPKCDREFRSYSGLMQHAEQTSCSRSLTHAQKGRSLQRAFERMILIKSRC
ncbi:hypothetical protein M501DRAFT_943909, partial [Patellaria atrata CBS 101060]